MQWCCILCSPARPAALDEIAIKLDTVVEGRTKLEVLDTARGEENNAVLETKEHIKLKFWWCFIRRSPAALDEAVLLVGAFDAGEVAALEAKEKYRIRNVLVITYLISSRHCQNRLDIYRCFWGGNTKYIQHNTGESAFWSFLKTVEFQKPFKKSIKTSK